jgi:hypothetical protein
LVYERERAMAQAKKYDNYGDDLGPNPIKWSDRIYK